MGLKANFMRINNAKSCVSFEALQMEHLKMIIINIYLWILTQYYYQSLTFLSPSIPPAMLINFLDS